MKAAVGRSAFFANYMRRAAPAAVRTATTTRSTGFSAPAAQPCVRLAGLLRFLSQPGLPCAGPFPRRADARRARRTCLLLRRFAYVRPDPHRRGICRSARASKFPDRSGTTGAGSPERLRPSKTFRHGETTGGGRWVDADRLALLSRSIESDLIIPPKLSYYPEIEDILWRTVRAAMIGEVAIPDALADIEAGLRSA